MIAFLHLFISWPFLVILLLAISTFVLIKYPILRTGLSQLLQSPSGVFGLLTLIAITIVTWIQPTVGGTAFAAFVAVVPAILAVVEHRETMLQMVQTAPPPPIEVINDIPDKGHL